jgi:two-component system cell cycle sensor histidine kinase/response regulator CckA
MLRRLIGEDVELITALAPDLAPIEVDPTQLEQIIMNLVLNARDAMPAGGRLTIETANVELDQTYARQNIEVEPGRYVVLAVTDTGQGIDAGTQAKIFEPFFTTKGQDQGTGLGLSTVYGIVKQSGGHIKVYSEPGWGSIFKVYLPQTVNEARPVSAQPVSTQSFQGTETILLVEDESGVRDFVEQLLTGYGYTVLAAARADEAAAFGRQYAGRIDLLLTDVILPDLTGPELAQQLAGDLMPALKVLYMSGYTDRAVLVNGVVEPNRTFIQKPFSPDALAQKLRDLLDQPES